MSEITDVVVVDWDFSTNRPCVLCKKEPIDYWQMAKVRLKFPGIISFTEILFSFNKSKSGKWICLECLGQVVCDMYDE